MDRAGIIITTTAAKRRRASPATAIDEVREPAPAQLGQTGAVPDVTG